MLKKSGLLVAAPGRRDFAESGRPGGAQGVLQAARCCSQGGAIRSSVPRGVLVALAAGLRQSRSSARRSGNEVGRPVLMLDVGTLMGSLVGQSEERTSGRPCGSSTRWPRACLMIDEVEKALRGVGSSGQTDSRRLGPDVRHVPVLAQRSRVGRVRGLHGERRLEAAAGVFAGRTVRRRVLPRPARASREGRDLADCISSSTNSIAASGCRTTRSGPAPRSRACCRLGGAARSAAGRRRPRTSCRSRSRRPKSVERLRTWASGRCLSADPPGIYRRDAPSATGSRRRVSRDPRRTNSTEIEKQRRRENAERFASPSSSDRLNRTADLAERFARRSERLHTAAARAHA